MQPKIAVRPLQEADLNAVIAIETRVYDFPWKKTIFQDCLHVGYCCLAIECDQQLAGYAIMYIATPKSHILNLCVHPIFQSMGLGKRLLDHLFHIAQQHHAKVMFLEVRPSNFQAIAFYLRAGFVETGYQRNYYPAKTGMEDALIFSKKMTV